VDAADALFPGFFAATVDDWVRTQPQLSFAWREGQLWRSEGAASAQARAGWRALWSEFWQEACARFGLASHAWLADRLFENEAFAHMIDWRRSVDRAALDEFARGVWAWLSGRRVPPAPWRDFARAQAIAAMPDAPEHDPTTLRIAAATATLIEQAGPSAVTHRAVAERVGLTLGVVSHKLRTKAELLQAGFESLYADALDRMRATSALTVPSDAAAALEGIADFFANSLGGRGGDALHLAVARDPALRPFGLQLRYLRGATSRNLLMILRPGAAEPSPLEAALMSGFLSALSRRHVDDDAARARPLIHAEIAAVVALLDAA
jgi:AcrR family transcriptional regulator